MNVGCKVYANKISDVLDLLLKCVAWSDSYMLSIRWMEDTLKLLALHRIRRLLTVNIAVDGSQDSSCVSAVPARLRCANATQYKSLRGLPEMPLLYLRCLVFSLSRISCPLHPPSLLPAASQKISWPRRAFNEFIFALDEVDAAPLEGGLMDTTCANPASLGDNYRNQTID